MMEGPVIVVLAAGRGERFMAAGGHTHKLDALLVTRAGARTVLGHVIAAAQASGLPWHVVRPQALAPDERSGMGTSIAMGVAATPEAKGWLILPGDLPLVRPQSLRLVAEALTQHPLVVPIVEGQQGHPVGFGPTFREALLSLRGDQGARQLLRSQVPFQLGLDDAGCVLDVDTPQALAQAQRLAQADGPTA
jgi:molybdenum cofactor cytidylyltransferase